MSLRSRVHCLLLSATTHDCICTLLHTVLVYHLEHGCCPKNTMPAFKHQYRLVYCTGNNSRACISLFCCRCTHQVINTRSATTHELWMSHVLAHSLHVRLARWAHAVSGAVAAVPCRGCTVTWGRHGAVATVPWWGHTRLVACGSASNHKRALNVQKPS